MIILRVLNEKPLLVGIQVLSLTFEGFYPDFLVGYQSLYSTSDVKRREPPNPPFSREQESAQGGRRALQANSLLLTAVAVQYAQGPWYASRLA